MYFMPLLSVLFINLFNFQLHSNMVSPRKYWCQDLDCFIKSYKGFYTLDMIPSKDAMERRGRQFKEILPKLKVVTPFGNRYVNFLIIYQFKLNYRTKRYNNSFS